ncbi:MAG: hypothetical protein ACOCUO_01510 [archaeon]
MSGLNPSENISPRTDFTSAIDTVARSNSQNIRSRTQLRSGETRMSFAIVLDANEAADSQFAFVGDALAPGDEAPFVVAETGEEMPYAPSEGANLITTRVSTSFNAPVKLKSYVNAQLQSVVYVDGGGWKDAQIAELAELIEYVDDLDGSNEIEWRLENVSSIPLEGSALIRTLEQSES